MDDPSNRQSIPGNLAALAAHYAAQRIEWQQPDEWRLDAQLQAWGAAQPLDWAVMDSEHFLTQRDELAALMGQRKQWLMEHFYRTCAAATAAAGRRRRPKAGSGTLTTTTANAGPAPRPSRRLAPPARPQRCGACCAAGVQSFGEPQAAALRWPLNRTKRWPAWRPSSPSAAAFWRL
jgi:deoxyribodipyrimidine photolyase-related protein